MPTLPWRFQSDLQVGVLDPDVMVFMGDTITNDVTGEQIIQQDTSKPEIIKLSALPAMLATSFKDVKLATPREKK